MKKRKSLYHGHRFPGVVNSCAVRWYFRFSLSLRDIKELLLERGVVVTYETVRCWCDKFGLHAFSRIWHKVYEDFVMRQIYEMRMQNALEQFEGACDRMPDSWLIVGDDVPLDFTPEQAYAMLLFCRHDEFWKP
ncbi:HipA family kinase [Paraburkholderia sediminicola]|uniref:HipA family kinase n=1 Tax=Paraburkholderia sediminicola TaxID=458836 RepID=UPI0038BABB76